LSRLGNNKKRAGQALMKIFCPYGRPSRHSSPEFSAALLGHQANVKVIILEG